jgi:hypothetical protein
MTADTTRSLQLSGGPGGDLFFAPITWWSGTFVHSFYPEIHLLTWKKKIATDPRISGLIVADAR